MATVAERCPACGVSVHAAPGTLRREFNETVEFKREDWLVKAILLIMGLLAVAGLAWFLK